MSEELIRLVQLPVIEQHLRILKDEVNERVAYALSLACTEDTVKAVKDVRAELNKQFNDLEARRKAVKSAVLAPYEQFEAVYKECVADSYKRADAELKRRIDGVQSELRARKEFELAEYFNEYKVAKGVEWLNYCDVAPNVTLSASLKKLKEEARATIDRVAQDVVMLGTLDIADEVMAEYKRNLNATMSIGIVQERHRRLEEEQAARAAREAAKAQQAEAVKKVEGFAPPKVEEPPKLARVTFTVTDTVERLRMLKQFLVSNGYKYE